jgi:hypothetical protein
MAASLGSFIGATFFLFFLRGPTDIFYGQHAALVCTTIAITVVTSTDHAVVFTKATEATTNRTDVVIRRVILVTGNISNVHRVFLILVF